jgi:hypothetical protein
MNKHSELKILIANFCIILFFIGNPKNTYSSEMPTELPFSLGDWVEWKSPIDRGDAEDDGRYNELYLSENKNLQQLIDEIYPQYINYRYYILQTDKTNYVIYIIMSSQKDNDGLFFHIVSIGNNKKIASLFLGGLIGDDGERKNFIISKDLKISLFDEKFFYSKKDDRVVVTEKKKTGTYQIQKDGRIVKQD